MFVNAARVRVTPEAMGKLLALPDGYGVQRFLQMPDGSVEVLVTGDQMPLVEGNPKLMDCPDFLDWLHPAKEAPAMAEGSRYFVSHGAPAEPAIVAEEEKSP